MEENKTIAQLIFDLANKLEADPEDLMETITMKEFFDSRKQSKEVSDYLDYLTLKEQ